MEAPPPRLFKELLSRYAGGERNFTAAELDEDPENNISGVCLDGVDLSQAFVVADFRGASLRDAVFREANVKTCDFSEADLTGADFRGAALCAAVFTGAKLAGARFEGASIHSYNFSAHESPETT